MKRHGILRWVAPSSSQGIAARFLLPLALTGCSFITVNGPPSDPDLRNAEAAKECTASKLAPGVDFGAVAASAISAAIVASGPKDAAPLGRTGGTIFYLGMAGVYAASATYGTVQTVRCDSLRDELSKQSESDGNPHWTPGLHGDAPADDESAKRPRGRFGN